MSGIIVSAIIEADSRPVEFLIQQQVNNNDNNNNNNNYYYYY